MFSRSRVQVSVASDARRDATFSSLLLVGGAGVLIVAGLMLVLSKLLRRSVEDYGQTIVMVTHDARAAAVAHRVLFLADGRIVRELGECDSHEISTVMEQVAAA